MPRLHRTHIPQRTLQPPVTTARTALESARIVARYTGWELWRNLRMVESTFFVIVLFAAMYLMFGVGMNVSLRSGYGNVAAYIMTSMSGVVPSLQRRRWRPAAVERSYKVGDASCR